MGAPERHVAFLPLSLLLLCTLSPSDASQVLKGPQSAMSQSGVRAPPRFPLKMPAPTGDGVRGASTDVRLEWAKTFKYQGGPMITWPLNVVNIFYGNWEAEEDQCAPRILGDLVKSISDTSPSSSGVPTVNDWWKTVGKYSGKNRKGESVKATSKVKLTNTWFMPAIPEFGKELSYDQISEVVARAAKKFGGTTVFKNSTVYNLFLPQGVTQQGFDSCAYHSRSRVYQGMYYCLYTHPRTSGVGGCGSVAGPWEETLSDGSRELRALTDYKTGSLLTSNGCLAADTLADTVIHELSEHVTDPLWVEDPAWLCTSTDQGGNQANCENADICTLLYISNPRNKGPPNKKNSWPKVSTEAISFKGARFSSESHAYFNLEGINGRMFYTAPQLDSISKLCTMSGA